MSVSVLVVDDDPRWRDVLRPLVTRAGLDGVAEAESVAAPLSAPDWSAMIDDR